MAESKRGACVILPGSKANGEAEYVRCISLRHGLKSCDRARYCSGLEPPTTGSNGSNLFHVEEAGPSSSCGSCLAAHGLEETATECKRLGAKAHTFVVDCSNREDIYSSAKKVKTEVGDVSILVNNAGVVYTSDLFATQDPQIEKTFEVNILAHFWTTKAFLPEMMKKNHGHIVTVSSAAGHTGVPFLLAYCMIQKAHSLRYQIMNYQGLLRSFPIESLMAHSPACSFEEGTGIMVDWHQTRSRRIPRALARILEPEEVVNKLIDGILTEQNMIFVPSSLSFLSLMEKVLPERFRAVLKRKVDVRFDAVIGYNMKGK
ncbi:estradiol 17-beta-dehydrogenase 11-like [Moschus berezovskii]|uniref:estradiol 17-beta-dehydrogenase 11-like n=1 Tax=Moschus berezovskii TaxID=68408 RepID=UPI00244509F5|nr:estradiol 17-beta-dehydrogenase 11-like [Moschus berezovskii]